MNDELKSKLILHRGYHNKYIVENTLLAFLKAVDKNYSIELDVRLLKDNTIVVFHDLTLTRLANIPNMVENYNYDELRKIKLKSKYSISKLTDVLRIVNGKVPVFIDIKGNIENYKLEKYLLEILNNYKGNIYIQSFNPKTLNWMRKHEERYKYGLIVFNYFHLKIIEKLFLKFKCDFICINLKALKDKNIQRNFKKKKLIGWTVTNYPQLYEYKDFCDYLICENIE